MGHTCGSSRIMWVPPACCGRGKGPDRCNGSRWRCASGVRLRKPRARRLIFSICAFAEGVGDPAVHGSLWRKCGSSRIKDRERPCQGRRDPRYRRPPGRCCYDGRAGVSRAGPAGAAPTEEEAEEKAPGLRADRLGPGLVPYLDPAFRVEAGMEPQDLVVEARGRVPPAKAASSGGTLGDADGQVDLADACSSPSG